MREGEREKTRKKSCKMKKKRKFRENEIISFDWMKLEKGEKKDEKKMDFFA